MSISSIKSYFSTEFETTELNSDDHKNQEVATHYYACTYDNAKAAVSTIAKNLGLNLKCSDDHYHEMLLENNKVSVIVTYNIISFYEISIDMKVKGNYLVGFNRPKKLVKTLYQELNRKISLKRIGDISNANI